MQRFKHISSMGYYLGLKLVALSLLLSLSLISCINEDFPIDNPVNPKPEPGTYSSIDLPCYIGVSITPTGTTSTRGPEDNGFYDGDANEYAIAPGEGHHYLIIYDPDPGPSMDATPLAIMPLTVGQNEWSKEGTDKNITLIVKKILSTGDFILGSNGSKIDLKNIGDIKDKLLKGNEAYVLLNFDRSQIANKSELGADYAPDGYPETINTDSDSDNPSVLFTFTRSQFFALCLKDYKITAKNSQGQDTQYFTMSNSVCLEKNSTTIFRNFNIASDNVFETEEEAENKPAIKVWVERVAVKYTVDFSQLNLNKTESQDKLFTIIPSEGSSIKLYKDNGNGGIEFTEDSYLISYDEVPYEIDVLGYGINGLENYSYMLKNINSNYESGNWIWNSPTDYRCYWAEDLHYVVTKDNKKFYPDQYRKSMDPVHPVRPLHDGTWKDGNIFVPTEYPSSCYLKYFTFNEFKGSENILYTFENTYWDDNGLVLGDRGYYSSAPHLIMCAQLKINGYPNVTDIFKCQNDVFYISERDLLESKLAIFNKIELHGGNHGLRILDTNWLHLNEGEGGYIPSDDIDIEGLTKVSWAENSVLWVKTSDESEPHEATASDLRLMQAELAGGDGEMLIAPNTNITEIYLAPKTDQGSIDDSKKQQITPNKLISLIYKIIGEIDHYKQGNMYYAAPITHNVESLDKDGYKKLGAVGSVRNNWYDIEISSVNGIGRPVDNPDQPIIPTQDVNRDYLTMTVTLLKWHRIQQDIDKDYP